MTPEGKATQAVRLRSAAWGIRLFRNNSGVLKDEHTGRPVRFGLGNESKAFNEKYKSGDLVGITPVMITPDMVGKTIGVFTNFEVKTDSFKIREDYKPGSREAAQNRFNKMVESLGGIAGFVRRELDVDQVIDNFIRRLKQ